MGKEVKPTKCDVDPKGNWKQCETAVLSTQFTCLCLKRIEAVNVQSWIDVFIIFNANCKGSCMKMFKELETKRKNNIIRNLTDCLERRAKSPGVCLLTAIPERPVKGSC
uniref:Uncharacterized protein n=1 Tax=Romanomermis culicivorax TaxID=13658 RepID=A0A915JHM6_ROMCU